MPVDPTFEVDDYNRGKILNESQTVAYNILTLLFAKPGFYPSIPSLGMDITSYFYRFGDVDLISEIKAKISSQCSDFLPFVESEDLVIEKATYQGQPMLVFIIPTIILDKRNELVLGVTVADTGQMQFNFTFNKQQYL